MTDVPPVPAPVTHTFAVVEAGACVNVAVCDDPDFAATQGWIGPLDGLTPQPGIGWAFDGTNWTAPAPPAPDPQQEAQATVATLAAGIPAYRAQIAADIATLQAMTPAGLTTVQALDIHRRVVAGLGTIVEGLAALVQAQGQ